MAPVLPAWQHRGGTKDRAGCRQGRVPARGAWWPAKALAGLGNWTAFTSISSGNVRALEGLFDEHKYVRST